MLPSVSTTGGGALTSSSLLIVGFGYVLQNVVLLSLSIATQQRVILLQHSIAINYGSVGDAVVLLYNVVSTAGRRSSAAYSHYSTRTKG